MRKVLYSCLMSIVLFSIVSPCVSATELDEELLHETVDDDAVVNAEVSCTIPPDFEVTIPKYLSAANRVDVVYTVGARGSIPSGFCLCVEPIDQYTATDGDVTTNIDVEMHEITGTKDSKLVQIKQERNLFAAVEMCDSEGVTTDGLLTGLDVLQAGEYRGTFMFNVELVESNPLDSAIPYTLKESNCDVVEVDRTGDVVIPETFIADDGLTYKVTKIADDTFRGCTDITSVVIPETVEYIGEYAFYNCTSLSSIELPDSVEEVGPYAFAKCTGLQSFDAGEGLTELSDYMLAYNTSLTEVNMENIVEIGDTVFYKDTSLSEITFGSNLKEIGNWAFSNCKGLVSVTIPDNVKTLGVGAFASCSSLESITVGTGISVIPQKTFRECSSLRDVTFKGTIDLIESLAFNNCSELSNLDINVNETSIQNSAFTDVPYVHANENLQDTTYGAMVYGHLSNGEGVCTVCGATCEEPINVCLTEELYSELSLPLEGDVVLPASFIKDGLQYNIVGISSKLLKYNDGITSITIPDGVQAIGTQAFNSCSSLETVVIADSVDAIGDYTFRACKQLKSVKLPDCLEILQGNLFRGCTLLQTVNIPEVLTKIEDSVFKDCTSLSYCSLPASCEDISENIFSGCTGLISVAISADIDTVPDSMFNECTSLKSVELPSTIRKVRSNAFYNCSSLEELVIPNEVTKIESNAFYKVPYVHYAGNCSSSSNWGAKHLGHNYVDGVCSVCGKAE